MLLPAECFVGAVFLIDGPFGTTVQRFTGVRQDGRLSFHGYDPEEGTTVWHPTADMIRSLKVVSWPQ